MQREGKEGLTQPRGGRFRVEHTHSLTHRLTAWGFQAGRQRGRERERK